MGKRKSNVIKMTKEMTNDEAAEERSELIVKEIKEKFTDYTERKVTKDDPEEIAYLKLFDAIRCKASDDVISEKEGDFRYMAEMNAFYAGASAMLQAISDTRSEVIPFTRKDEV